ncbi:hypothetical protein RDI58_023846 [Solanum bulbocastanum]|uniref:Uncharacterized protein n=1 Tax=Solanum bulbocastanum TaxID=147425 RepID=A0AAN8Y2R2_SOLBU
MFGISGQKYLYLSEANSIKGGLVKNGLEKIVEGKVDVGIKKRTKFEKRQAEIREEYNFIQQQKRYLEFMEKGGDPLDFKFMYAAPRSLLTSLGCNKKKRKLVDVNDDKA